MFSQSNKVTTIIQFNNQQTQQYIWKNKKENASIAVSRFTVAWTRNFAATHAAIAIIEKGKSFATRQQMTEKGFDFKYFTHVYKTKTGSVYYIVYDQAYLPKEGSPDSFLLVKFDER